MREVAEIEEKYEGLCMIAVTEVNAGVVPLRDGSNN